MMPPKTLAEYFDSGTNNFHLIRLLAALAVIYGHSYVLTGMPGGDFFLQNVGYKFIGGVAVDVFFLISGFLIASSLERSSWKRYIAARVLRIVPALVVCVALSVFVLGPLMTTAQDYWTNAATWRYFVQNAFLLSTEYRLPGVFESLPDKGVNGSLWSLPLEFRLYIAFFALGLLRLMKPSRFSAVAIVVVVIGYFATPKFALLVQYSNWVNSSLFFVAGGFMWHNRQAIRMSYPLAALMLVLCAALLHTDHFGAAYFLALSYLTMFVAFVPRLPRIRERDLSYGVYLYGWPVAQIIQYLRPTTSPMENTFAACLCSLAVALASWEFIERPALSLKRLVR